MSIHIKKNVGFKEPSAEKDARGDLDLLNVIGPVQCCHLRQKKFIVICKRFCLPYMSLLQIFNILISGITAKTVHILQLSFAP